MYEDVYNKINEKAFRDRRSGFAVDTKIERLVPIGSTKEQVCKT